jgi:hypothetical protein
VVESEVKNKNIAFIIFLLLFFVIAFLAEVNVNMWVIILFAIAVIISLYFMYYEAGKSNIKNEKIMKDYVLGLRIITIEFIIFAILISIIGESRLLIMIGSNIVFPTACVFVHKIAKGYWKDDNHIWRGAGLHGVSILIVITLIIVNVAFFAGW